MIEVGKRYLFSNGYVEDVNNLEYVTVTSVDSGPVAQVLFNDTAYHCVTDDGVEGIAFAEELMEIPL